MVHRVGAHDTVRPPGLPQSLLVPPGHRRGAGEDLDDGGAERRRGTGVEPGDVVGHPAALAVGHVGEGDERRAAADGVDLLDGVADGVHVGVAGAAGVVDGDAATGPDREPGHLGQAGVGAHADRADHELPGDLAPVGQADTPLGHLGDGDAGLDPHAVLDELGLDEDRHLGVEGRQHLVGGLDDRDLDARMAEVLGRLEADEAGTDHDGRRRSGRHGAEEVLGVLDGAQHLDPVEAGDRRPHGHRAGAQHELVERQLVLAAVGRGAHRHAVPDGVDADDLGVDPDVEAEALEQLLGRLQEQVVLVLDDAADVVREAAVGVGDVTGPFDHHDLGPLVEAAEPGGRGHATGHPTHHHDPHRACRPSVASEVLLGVGPVLVLIALLQGGPSLSTVSPRGYLQSWFVASRAPVTVARRDRPADGLRPPPDPPRREARGRRRPAPDGGTHPRPGALRAGCDPDVGARLPRRRRGRRSGRHRPGQLDLHLRPARCGPPLIAAPRRGHGRPRRSCARGSGHRPREAPTHRRRGRLGPLLRRLLPGAPPRRRPGEDARSTRRCSAGGWCVRRSTSPSGPRPASDRSTPLGASSRSTSTPTC